MAFPGNNYAPPGPYTKTLFENPTQPLLAGLKLPIFIGTGSEILTQNDLEVVRGSSSTVDQRIVQEDETGRAVVSVSTTGQITLGAFNGIIDRIQVRNYPIVTGGGTGTTATNASAVSVTINGNPIVVLQIDGARGILKLSTPPSLGDDVQVSYFFNREDTQTTDNVSAQVTAVAARVYGAVGQTYAIVTGNNDTLSFLVDDSATVSVTLPESNPGVPWSSSQIAAFINSAANGTSLLASTYTTNFGEVAVLLTADRNISVGDGSANSTFGFTNGATTGRTATFYTFEGPIVDGTNGGVTTTDPSDVVVKVDGIQVIPTAVDGQNRAVTLPFAPQIGATVTIQYYFNTWQSTFDYLAHTEVTAILRAGATPDRNDYINGADFILKNDRILWGTASTIESGIHTSGTNFFDDTQITTTLVDVRQYLAEAVPVTNTTVSPPVTSVTEFTLPLVPTTGNGRDTPLGASLFQSVTNNRIDLPTNRPDLVTAYWGFGIQDALERGAVSVLKVDSSTATITLAVPVPVGAQVFATFYYNTLVDQEYTLTVDTAGAAGVGTYMVSNEDGTVLLTPSFGSKSAGLAGITISFPSGSERTPDVRFEVPFDTTYFQGPVEEDVTVTFAAMDSTLAKFSSAGNDPYFFITGASDNIDIEVDGAALTGGFIDLSNVNGISGLGFNASYVGDEVLYEADTGSLTYDVNVTNQGINLTLDGVLIAATANINATGTLDEFVGAINRAAVGETGLGAAAGSGVTTLEFPVGSSDVDDYYVGWTVYVTAGTNIGTTATITAYDAGTLTATTDAGTFSGPADDVFSVWDSASRPRYVGATKFSSAVILTGGEYNALTFHYTGDVSTTSGDLAATIAPGSYTSASTLATAVQAAVDTALGTLGAAFDGIDIAVSANSSAQLMFALTKASGDSAGYLEFITGSTSQATGSATINVLTLAPADIITIGGVPLTANASVARTPGSDDFDPTTPGTAQLLSDEIVAAINDPLNSFTGLVVASNAGGTTTTITLTAVPIGTLGNVVTLATTLGTPADITLSGALLTGGSNAGANDFAILAGLDSSAATGEGQVKLIDGPVARRFSIAGDNTGALLNDRLILRNRLVPGAGTMDAQHSVDQANLVIEGSSGATATGLTVNAEGEAGWRAAVMPATLLATIGFADGQVPSGTYSDERDGQPLVTFYAAGGTQPQNNVLKFTFDGTPITVAFTDAAGVVIPTAGSADVPIGPSTAPNSIINQIAAALATAGFGGSAAAVIGAGLILQEGAGFRLRSTLSKATSNIFIGSGNANDALGFVDGAQVLRTTVTSGVLASALMAHAGGSLASILFDTWGVVGAPSGYFAGDALAATVQDSANASYLFVQSLGNAGLGTSSSVGFDNASSDSVLLPGTGFGVNDGDGAVGEVGISGYYVTSSDPADGSGASNTSVLNSGVGQDGTVGASYRDETTGLMFTVLAREGGSNYPDGETFTLKVRRVTTTDSNIPIRTLPGVELLVTNTQGIGVGDTAIVSTYERGGNEPSVGDTYYITYEYAKQDFSTKTFTKFAAIEAEYGTNGPENPVTLASYLAILNGAVLIGVKQVEKDIDEDNDGVNDTASVNAFIAAVDSLEGPLPGGILPNILVPLDVPSSSTADFFSYIARHADIQSTIRRRAERTVITGFPAGTQLRAAGDTAAAIARSRLRLVYPDVATLSLTQADGTEEEFLVDGTILGSALAGSVVAPSVDVATPWTNRRLFGFNQLARTLDAVQQNQVAVRGVTVLTDASPAIKVRQGFSTDMSNVLTKTPTVIQIADEVQQQARITLDRFIGIKFLPGVLSQIEGQLSTTLKLLVDAEILTTYTGVRANTADNDPTTAEVEAYYQPVFPLLYIIVTFHLRASL